MVAPGLRGQVEQRGIKIGEEPGKESGLHCPRFAPQAAFGAILAAGDRCIPAPNTRQALTRIPEAVKTSRPKDFKTKQEEKERFDENLVVEIITAGK